MSETKIKLPVKKIVLLAVAAALALIYILQLCFTGKSKVEILKLDSTPDKIVIENSNGTVELTYKDSAWYVGQKMYSADAAKTKNLVSGIKEIKLLGTVAKNAAGTMDRYGLEDGSAIKVTAYKDSTVLRTLNIGKSSAGGEQSYVTVDSKNSVSLAGGGLNSLFNTSTESIRSSTIWDGDSITAVKVVKGEENFSLKKNGSMWEIAENNATAARTLLDQEKVHDWTEGMLTLKASSWAEDDMTIPGEIPFATIYVTVDGREHVVTIYNDADENRKLCSCNTLPFMFYITKYTSERFVKNLADLMS